ncbi:MAG: OmpA family protein [Polyangiaceae bacterium]
MRARAQLGLGLGVLLAPALASAQDIDGERFKPAATHDGFATAEGSAVRPEQDRWELGFFANYARGSIIVVDGNGDYVSSFVNNRVGFDLVGSVTVAGPFAIGIDIPFFIPQTGDFDPSIGGLGDIRVVPKLRILDDRDTVGLAIVAEIRAPTHAGDFAGGTRIPVFWPKLVLDHRFWGSGFRLGMNAGVLIREGTTFGNVDAASEFSYAAAMGYRFGANGEGPVELGLEFWGGVGLAATDIEEVPLETTLFFKAYPNEEWTISGGPAVGLISGFAVPTFRAWLGVQYTPTSHDRDGDGIPDDEDQCPDAREDKDGDEDLDGCPEEDPDDDSDGVPNNEDDCPDQKETINGIQDEDGCPDGGPAKVIYESGEIKILENVQFRTGSAEIDERSHSILNQVALVMKANKNIERVRVEGHTDDTGPRDVNMRLSKARAESVRRYLIYRGVASNRLHAEGYGPDQPLMDDTTDEARAKNRRVEFIVEQE